MNTELFTIQPSPPTLQPQLATARERLAKAQDELRHTEGIVPNSIRKELDDAWLEVRRIESEIVNHEITQRR